MNLICMYDIMQEYKYTKFLMMNDKVLVIKKI